MLEHCEHIRLSLDPIPTFAYRLVSDAEPIFHVLRDCQGFFRIAKFLATLYSESRQVQNGRVSRTMIRTDQHGISAELVTQPQPPGLTAQFSGRYPHFIQKGLKTASIYDVESGTRVRKNLGKFVGEESPELCYLAIAIREVGDKDAQGCRLLSRSLYLFRQLVAQGGQLLPRYL